MHKHGGDIYRNQGVVDYSANINFRGMPESVRQAAKDAIDASVCYPDPQCEELKAAIAEKENVPAEWIFCGNGAADVIFSLVLALKPQKALLPIPSFYEYRQALESVGCQISEILLKEDEAFCLQKRFVNEIPMDTDMVCLCNPNNPTGQLIDREVLEQVADYCQKTDTCLLLDECFHDFLEEGSVHTLLPRVKENPKLFVLRAFTKMYGMAGLRLGYGICSDTELIRRMEQVTQPWNVSVPAQAAGIAAAREQEFVAVSRQMITEQKKLLLAGLEAAGAKVYGSAANYIFFRAAPGFDTRMYRAGFMVRNCGNYDGLTEGFYRIAVRGEADNRAFLQALQELEQTGWQNRLWYREPCQMQARACWRQDCAEYLSRMGIVWHPLSHRIWR